MPQTLPQLKRNNAPWTPLQRRTWLAEQRRKHHQLPAQLLPAPVLRAVYPDLLQWDWDLPNPYKWNVWLSLDDGVTFMLPSDYWIYGDARQFAPDGGGELHFIVGVDESGREVTQRSNAVRPDDATLPANLIFGFDGTLDGNLLVDMVYGSSVYGYPNGDPPAYVADWTAGGIVVPHCIVSNRSGAFYQSDPITVPNAGSKGTIAIKILLPPEGSYHGFAPYFGDWGMQMVFIGSGYAVGGADDAVALQTPVGCFLSSILSFPNDGLFHWVVFRWNTPNGFYDLSLDGMTDTFVIQDFGGEIYDWPETYTFQTCAPWEDSDYVSVISQASYWDAPLTDLEKDNLIAT